VVSPDQFEVNGALVGSKIFNSYVYYYYIKMYLDFKKIATLCRSLEKILINGIVLPHQSSA